MNWFDSQQVGAGPGASSSGAWPGAGASAGRQPIARHARRTNPASALPAAPACAMPRQGTETGTPPAPPNRALRHSGRLVPGAGQGWRIASGAGGGAGKTAMCSPAQVCDALTGLRAFRQANADKALLTWVSCHPVAPHRRHAQPHGLSGTRQRHRAGEYPRPDAPGRVGHCPCLRRGSWKQRQKTSGYSRPLDLCSVTTCTRWASLSRRNWALSPLACGRRNWSSR